MRTTVRRCAALALATVAAMAAGSVAGAQNRVEITRGEDSVVYGSCVPSLKAVNNTPMTVDYVEVTLRFTLSNGDSRTLEFRSRYREGIERPIGPGAMADLKVQLDLSRPLGVGCQDIVSIQVGDAICEAQGRPCGGVVSIDTGRR
jgi:hypothetical protein